MCFKFNFHSLQNFFITRCNIYNVICLVEPSYIQMAYEVHVLENGYSEVREDGKMIANCTCTLLKGKHNIIVDTMTPWDKQKIIDGLKNHGLNCDDIDFLVCTHGHSDHIGNNNLFLKAQHIMGGAVNFKDEYDTDSFKNDQPYVIDDAVQIIQTPGHTLSDITVIVKSKNLGTVAVTGDLFEREEDLMNPSLWRDVAGSEDPVQQEANRNKVCAIADYIVPGHGRMFKVAGKPK